MSTRTRHPVPTESRPARGRRMPSYDSYDSFSDSDDSGKFSDSSDDEPQQKRRSSVQPSRNNALAKAPVHQAPTRRAVSEHRYRKGANSKYYDSDSDDSSSDSSDDDNESDATEEKDRNDVTSYHKQPKSKMQKRIDGVLDSLGLLQLKNNPSQRQFSSEDPEKYAKQKQALQAAVTAAAIEAWRSHSKPGGFNATKAVRIALAAIAAGGVDILVDNHPGHQNMRDLAEAVVGGLATSQALGGKITHRREGGAQGKMIDGFIALAASKMVKPPKGEELERRKEAYAKRSKSLEPVKHRSSTGSSKRR